MDQIVNAIQSVDPDVWVLLGGAVTPWIQNGLKKIKDLNRSQNYAVSIGLAAVVGSLGTLVDNGSFGAHTGVAFLVAQSVYGLFLKVHEELRALTQPAQ